MSVTEEIKAKLDIVSYVQQYVPLKKSGRHYKACCPFHAEDTPSFMVNAERQTWRCFGACAEGGDIFSFAQKHHGWTFPEALRELGSLAGIAVHKQTPAEKQKQEREERLRGLLKTAGEMYHRWLVEAKSPQAQATLAYVKEKRGLTDETIVRFELGFAPDSWESMRNALKSLGYAEADIIDAGLAVRKEGGGGVYDRFRNRLMIPIRDSRGRVVGFGARALNPDDNPKYLNSAQSAVFDKSRLLFGLDTAKHAIRESETAVIVEGYLDVIQAHQAGFTNVVAQMGTALTESQITLIVPHLAKKIVLALDSDPAGQNATRRSLETARQVLESDYAGRLSVDIRVLQIPGAKDPDDLIRETPDAWSQLVDDSQSVTDFIIGMETGALPTGAEIRNVSVQERMALAHRVLPLLAASESNLYVESNVQQLAARLYLNERELLDWARQHRAQKARHPQASRRASQNVQETQPPDFESPPPLDYDALPPPPFDSDDVFVSDSFEQQKRLHPSSGGTQPYDNAAEAYCLRLLFGHPEMYFQVNRKFRELAGSDARLLNGPLGNLCGGDFSRSDYGHLMDMFVAGVDQHDVLLVEFMLENLDPVMRREFDALLIDEHERIRQHLNRRFDGDWAVEWKRYEQHAPPASDSLKEALKAALKLRWERLRREMDEYGFLVAEGVYRDNGAAAYQIAQQVLLLKRAVQRLDVAVHQQLPQFV